MKDFLNFPTNMLFQHKTLKHLVTVTDTNSEWVEFWDHSYNELRWLEVLVFEEAHTPLNLDELRQERKAAGVAIPKAFLY